MQGKVGEDVGAVVSDTIVNKAGAEYSGAAGINVGYTQNLTLMHNDVSNLTYVPITVGWGWSRHECYNCTNAGSNMIAWNRCMTTSRCLTTVAASTCWGRKTIR